MRLHLGGHLAWYDPERRSWLDVAVSQPTSVRALAAQLHLPVAEIAIVALNGKPVPPPDVWDLQVSDGDRLELYPPMGGG